MPGETQCHNRNTEETVSNDNTRLESFGETKRSYVGNIHLIAIPAHHVEDIEDPIGVTVDTVKDGVTVSDPTSCKNEEIANTASLHISCLSSPRTKSSIIPAPLASVTTRQVTREGLDLFATFTVHLKWMSLLSTNSFSVLLTPTP